MSLSGDGDVFHELFRYRPHHLSNVSPDIVQGVELHDGEWGTVRSVFFWKYTHDRKEEVAKEIIEAIDEEKRSVTNKVNEGHLLESYKTFSISVHVDIHCEKLNDTIPVPNKLMDAALKATKEIGAQHLK